MQANWSSGVAAARGIYFGKLDDDNHYEPTFLERLVEILETHSEVAFAFTDEWIIDESGKRNLPLTDELSQYYQRANLPSGVLVNPQLHAASQGMGINATLFRLSILREVGGFGNYGATADCELFLRLTSLRKSCAYLSERLAEYRIHETSFSTGLKGIRESEFPVQMWERYSFSDPQAEQARLERLSTSYLMLARAYALEGKLAEARQVLKKITPPLPGVKKAQLFHRIFSLPEALVRVLIKRKYSV